MPIIQQWKQTIAIDKSMAVSHKYDSEWKKPDATECILKIPLI